MPTSFRFTPDAIKERAVGLLFPRRCPVCNDIVTPKGRLICPECLKELSFVKQPTCMKCGKEVFSESAEYCFDCGKRNRSFDYGMALVNYNEAARNSMTKIKYKNKREYLDFYIEEIASRYGGRLLRTGADALIPVPVHPARKRSRGFNQAEILAAGISRRIGIPCRCDILFRNKKTAPQKELSPAERLKNLERAFEVKYLPPHVRSVLLADDIYTTGSTAEACARALKKAGVKHVYFITICIGHGQ